jgi:metal-responsive CopG/Arc/MetJ family transcriptional regulator
MEPLHPGPRRHVSVKLPPTLYEALDRKAARTGLTTSEIIRLALIDSLLPEDTRMQEMAG